MPKILVPQNAPKPSDFKVEVSDAELKREPMLRRATTDFVQANGGDIAREFLKFLDGVNLLRDNTSFIVQGAALRPGTYPSLPGWHTDWIPGFEMDDLREHIRNPVRGMIACLFSEGMEEETPTTEFLTEAIELDQANEGGAETFRPIVSPSSEILYLAKNSGDFISWVDPQVRHRLASGNIERMTLEANRAYFYNSTNIHHPPLVRATNRFRLLLRANTPPDDFKFPMPEGVVYRDTDRAYIINNTGTGWILVN